jgi:hypothetical protein
MLNESITNINVMANDVHDSMLLLKDTRPDLAQGLIEVRTYLQNIRDVLWLDNVQAS